MDLSNDILIGRPYGGTAIMYRKSFTDKIHVCHSDISRITAVVLDTDAGPMLIANVYMPTNYGDLDSLELYVDCVSKLHALIIDTNTTHVIIAGDFNCDVGSRFFDELSSFVLDNNLIVSDMSRLSNAVTYVSDDCTKYSWIDHVVSSADVDNMISNICVLNDVIVSDHKPLSLCVQCRVLQCPVLETTHQTTSAPDWNSCSSSILNYYACYLDTLLQSVVLPHHLYADYVGTELHTTAIDTFYRDIIDCINKAVANCIPINNHRNTDYNVPGWNTYVAEKHEIARNAYLYWRESGKPRFGYCFENMKQTRAHFKLALRHCRDNVEEMKANACAEALFDTEPHKFWQNVNKISNSKANAHVVSVGGVAGQIDIADMWRQHYEKLYNSKADSKHRTILEQKLLEKLPTGNSPIISVTDVSNALSRQKCRKAPGPDGLQMEAFMFAGHRLCIMLSILFDMFFRYSYVPAAFCESTIVPIVKCKTGDLTDVNNYRAIALSNAISKILEHVLFDYIVSEDVADDYQFGFKKRHSTADCTFVLKRTVDYYMRNGSHVFTCFIDFKQAFDSVDYWLLFCRLLDNSSSVACSLCVRLLTFWYSHQLMRVRWQGVISSCFSVSNGVRQGGILSPFLFRYYIRDLIRAVTNSGVGCTMFNQCLNLLAYADDLVILAPSWQGLQYLINTLVAAADDVGLTVNAKKTVTMIFSPYDNRKRLHTPFPQFSVHGSYLSTVSCFKYLGHIIDNTLHDDSDINRELKCLFTRANLLNRRFWRCTIDVKLRLFRAFCMCYYNIGLWTIYKAGSLKKLAAAYVKCIKIFFGYHKYCSVSFMLLELGLPTFNTAFSNAVFMFKARAMSSVNCLVKVATCV